MITKNSDETIDLGYRIGKLLDRGSVLTLKGDLAGGKTTFTILKIYEGKMPLYHIDAYRLDGNPYDLGISEYEDEGIMVIEWPECYKDFLPDEYLEISFNYIDDNTREIEFKAHGKKYEKILEVLNA